MIGSRQPRSSQTGASSRQTRCPPALAGSLRSDFAIRSSLLRSLCRTSLSAGGPPTYSWFTAVFLQPIRVSAKNIASDPRTCWLWIATVPAGGVIPKIVATIKLLIRACSSAAPISSSLGKCFLSDFGSSGFSVYGLTTMRQILSCGIPSPTKTFTFLRCSWVGTNAFRPLRPATPDIQHLTRLALRPSDRLPDPLLSLTVIISHNIDKVNC